MERFSNFYGFECQDAMPEMTHLFCDPKVIGKGFGKMLWHHVIVFAESKGLDSIKIVAARYASEKSTSRWVRKLLETLSSVRPGRKLPLLRLDRPS